MEHLFVYGTLLQDFKSEVLHSIKAFLKFESDGYLNGKLYDLGEYPAVIGDSETSFKVKGEIYLINNPAKVFDVLDEYEGINDHDAEYSRKKKIVTLTEGKEIRSWVYIYKKPVGPHLKRIQNGDYLTFINHKTKNG